jgi:GTPase
MFIDEISLNIHSGKGGHGIVSWKHEKGKDHAGPGGGDGGKGGDVYIIGVNDINRLSEYRFEKDFCAEDGQNGKLNNMHGGNGKDLVLELPIGSVIKNSQGVETEILSREKILFLKGGRGGYGNAHFKGPKNIRPEQFTLGKSSEGGTYQIELKLVADLGLIGLPNAGKSSLLNTITKSKAKIGAYQFTTLSPNLGNFYGFILADIPGLIEGASEGKGLGHKFLRHIKRTKILMHCISSENKNPLEAYETVREELDKYNKELSLKPEIILFTKSDMCDKEKLSDFIKFFRKKHKFVLNVSVIDDASVKEFSDELVKILEKA